MEDDAAFVQPVVCEFGRNRRRVCFGARRFGIGDQPQVAAVAEPLRKIGEDVGEDFAFAALWMANARQPRPFFCWCNSRLRCVPDA